MTALFRHLWYIKISDSVTSAPAQTVHCASVAIPLMVWEGGLWGLLFNFSYNTKLL